MFTMSIFLWKMAKLNVITFDQVDNKILSQACKPVAFPLIVEVQQCLIVVDTFADLDEPYGLAANQIGYPWQILLYQIPESALHERKDALAK